MAKRVVHGGCLQWNLPKPSTLTDNSFYGILERNNRDMEFAFKLVFDAILKYSKLDITSIRISNVTETYFYVSLEARASNTGPASATLSPMSIELCGSKGCFGKILFPEFNTTPRSAHIMVENQLVEITNKAALLAFIIPAMKNSSAMLSLKNGQSTVTVAAFGIGPRPIVYARDVPIVGMNGPGVSIKSASIRNRPTTSQNVSSFGTSNRTGVTVTFHVKNPSPVELSLGICEFEIQNENKEVFATLKGLLDIRNLYFDVMFYGEANKRVTLREKKARLVGKRCLGAGWCDQTIKAIDVPIADVWKLLKALDLDYEDPKPESPQVFRWREKYWKKGTWI
ncbi:hypothetical protein F4804DRAFT_283402 [Jackrogersella minutella]|nr:hypothetical protein F4804DRAFT_283402 [Jackrogersella minutella]